MMRAVGVSTLAVALAPSFVFAQAVSQVSGVFNIIVGLMLVVALLLFGTGLCLWYVRLGVWPGYRDEAIHIMQWGVSTMFVLVVLVGAVRLVQTHPKEASFMVGALIVLAVAWFVVKVFASAQGEEEAKH